MKNCLESTTELPSIRDTVYKVVKPCSIVMHVQTSHAFKLLAVVTVTLCIAFNNNRRNFRVIFLLFHASINLVAGNGLISFLTCPASSVHFLYTLHGQAAARADGPEGRKDWMKHFCRKLQSTKEIVALAEAPAQDISGVINFV